MTRNYKCSLCRTQIKFIRLNVIFSKIVFCTAIINYDEDEDDTEEYEKMKKIYSGEKDE